MHKFVAFILLVAFLGQTFDQGFFYLDYIVQKKDYLARCENKSRPELQCKGKCQLMKKIMEQQKKEQGEAPELKLSSKAEIVAPSFRLAVPVPLSCDDRLTFILYSIGTPVDAFSSLFHPPDRA